MNYKKQNINLSLFDFSIKAVFGTGLIFLFSANAWTQGAPTTRSLMATPVGVSAPSRTFQDEKPTVDNCSLDCLYQTAVEYDVFDYSYSVQKYEVLMSGFKNANTSQEKIDSVRSNIGPFCQAIDISLSGSANAKTCLDLYGMIHQRLLIEKANAIIQNRAQIKELISKNSKQLTAFEKEDSSQSVNGIKKPEKKHITYVPTYEDLKNEYKSNVTQLEKLASDDFAQTIKNLRAPKLEDFPKFKLVERIEGDKNSGTLLEVEKNNLGKPVYDEVRFQAALDLYNQNGYQQFKKDELELTGKVSKAGDLEKGIRIDAAQIFSRHAKSVFAASAPGVPAPSTVTSVEEDNYNKARIRAVDAAQKKLAELDVEAQKAREENAKRGIASGAANNPSLYQEQRDAVGVSVARSPASAPAIDPNAQVGGDVFPTIKNSLYITIDPKLLYEDAESISR